MQLLRPIGTVQRRLARFGSPCHKSVSGAGRVAGVRIIELSTVVMGPFASQILADVGADVI